MALFAFVTWISKKPFQPNICEVNKKGFIDMNKGRSIVDKMVNTMMMLMAATMGPMEFSANRDNKKDKAATVVMAMAANAKAAR